MMSQHTSLRKKQQADEEDEDDDFDVEAFKKFQKQMIMESDNPDEAMQ